METRVIVSAIIQKGDYILLGKKAKGRPPYPDVWHLLGGGVEDEFQRQAIELIEQGDYNNMLFIKNLEREVWEESRIEIKSIQNICPKYRTTPRETKTNNKYGVLTHYIFLEYLCEYKSGKPTPNDDIKEVKWVDKRNLPNVQVTKPSHEMYKELGWI